jgi:hypothetical protein
MVRGAANRGVAQTTGAMSRKRLSVTPAVANKTVANSTPKPSRKKKARKSEPTICCELCRSTRRTRATAMGKRCFDCWRDEQRLLELWSSVPESHLCSGMPSRATCSSISHRKFYMVASSLALRSRNGQIDITHIVRSVQSHALDVAEQKRVAARQKQERKREAAALRETARAKATHEQQERARKASIARKEAQSRQLMDEIRRDVPIEDLQEALSKLRGRWNEG